MYPISAQASSDRKSPLVTNLLHCGSVRARRFVIAVILCMSVGGPIVEAFDQWDRTLQDGTDTEANLVVVALCVGLALSGTGIILARVRSLLGTRLFFPGAAACAATGVAPSSFVCLIPNSRPPTILRV